MPSLFILKIHHFLQIFVIFHQSVGWLGSPSAGVYQAPSQGCIWLAMSGEWAQLRQLGWRDHFFHGISFRAMAMAVPEQCSKRRKAEAIGLPSLESRNCTLLYQHSIHQSKSEAEFRFRVERRTAKKLWPNLICHLCNTMASPEIWLTSFKCPTLIKSIHLSALVSISWRLPFPDLFIFSNSS